MFTPLRKDTVADFSDRGQSLSRGQNVKCKMFEWPAKMSGNTARGSTLLEKDGMRSKEAWWERHNWFVPHQKD